ncbi:hypothetical protein jhhlp_000459 [Lomentospora prolificans]|uniref:Alpha/beta hydrolase fold-3 domain-containing protein n=1 Tax=Lomentospora prolificans TaxID=41688 RepID=A0A2N3NL10_9PEZI|nr:hypothetical protein jhhlp_000459 [Lomentospora prolificans]
MGDSDQPTWNDTIRTTAEPLPILTRVYYGSIMSAIQSLAAHGRWYKGWQEYFYPPEKGPNIVKTYDIRQNLPIRIFFPSSYDQTSPQTLPTLFSIHGGGFCLGTPAEIDGWNRHFADMHNFLVISLNYSKAPWYPFPTAVTDVAALYVAAVDDESLPIDPARIAVTGFSAGGNLALALSQVDSVRNHPKAAPSAVVPIYPCTTMTVPPSEKAKRRQYKMGSKLGGIRSQKRDWVLPIADVFDWAYLKVGTDLRDPLCSPYFAPRDHFPKHVFVVGAELDFLVCEAHQFALKLAGKQDDPRFNSIPGRPEAGTEIGKLELEDERFAWEEDDGKGGSVRWLLVPDQVHAFDVDAGRAELGDEEGVRDAVEKTEAYVKLMGEWLLNKVWA